MSIRRAILTSALALTTLTLTAAPATAATRELVTTFGTFGEPAGIAVDLETGNVYVTENKNPNAIGISGPTGGAPADGIPAQITTAPELGTRGHVLGVAVDNSCYEHEPRLTGRECEEYDPAYGDVYVVDSGGVGRHGAIQKFKLSPSHQYELVGEIGSAAYGSHGLTVDSRGNLYVVGELNAPPALEFKKVLKKVVNGGKDEVEEELEELTIPQKLERDPSYVAVDDLGDLYVSIESEESGNAPHYVGVERLKLNGSGGVASEEIFTGPIEATYGYRPLAIDRASGAVYVGDGTHIAEYNSAGALQLVFGSTEALGGSLGSGVNGAFAIAVNSVTGLVYVVNPAHYDVDVFGASVAPAVFEAQQPAASSVSRTSALVGGTVNPESGNANYSFEYVDAGEYQPGATDPYVEGGRTAITALAGGHTPETVERVVLAGLLPGTTYDYRMVVTNADTTTDGPDETFTTAAATPPAVSTGPAGEVSATSATLSGVVGPRGLPTSYVFEVGTDTAYGGAKLFGNAGDGTGEVPVTVSLQYLVPGTIYHYRLVATSFDGTSYGQDGTFTTLGVPATVVQPATTPLIASPSVQFPSTAGAITEPIGAGRKSGKRAKHGKRHGKHRAAKSTGRGGVRHAGKRR
jgi:hypothetical protein